MSGTIIGDLFSGAGEGLLKGFGSAVKGIREAITGKEIITGQERMDLVNKLHEIEMAALEVDKSVMQAQTEINKIEAESSSSFRGNWRPAVGWVCVAGLIYQYFIVTLFPWCIKVTIIFTGSKIDLPILPNLDMGTLLTLLLGMLGLGGLRTYEKIKGLK